MPIYDVMTMTGDVVPPPSSEPGYRIEAVRAPYLGQVIAAVDRLLALGWRSFLSIEREPGAAGACVALMIFTRSAHDDGRHLRGPGETELAFHRRRVGELEAEGT